MGIADQCRRLDCGRKWTVEAEAEDGFSTFLCGRHFEDLPDVDPDHGRVVRATGYTGFDEALREPVGEGGHRQRRKTRRKAERAARKRH